MIKRSVDGALVGQNSLFSRFSGTLRTTEIGRCGKGIGEYSAENDLLTGDMGERPKMTYLMQAHAGHGALGGWIV